MSDERPLLNQFNLVVRDMAATIAFYRRLGLSIKEGQPDWANHHVTAVMPEGIDLDFDSVEFARQWDSGWPGSRRARMGVLGFGVSSREAVDALYADLTGAGYHGQQAPYDAFWGARYAIVEDPDGNAVGLMSPADPERRSRVRPPRAQ
ncbi:MAG: VOC family protein [Chloroflexi bacterium]|nr:VOC family protein [Chloroflexota bacterium]